MSMFDYINGEIQNISPAAVTLDNNGIGYLINISLTTYSEIQGKKNQLLYIYENIREDAHDLYGFSTQTEREVFRLLISVSGVGSNTARMMLSSLKPKEIETAILTSDVNSLKSIKGIGLKTAQRIIVELKDKVGKSKDNSDFLFVSDNTQKSEALSGLVMLGFNKTAAEKVVDKIISGNPSISVENIVKQALKML